MLFNSVEFAIYLPIVFVLYWYIFDKDIKRQNIFLLCASYFFYGWWSWKFIFLILISSLVDYLIGAVIHEAENELVRKLLLVASLCMNLGCLILFKYFDFFIEAFVGSFSLLGLPISSVSLHIVLPIGISFYTFQTLSYSIDIYRRDLEPTKDIVSFLVYVSFFPQLIAGPIERAKSFLPQLGSPRRFDYNLAIGGVSQVFWGLIKKVVIADRLAIYTEVIFSDPSSFDGFQLLIGVFFFTFQIYCDFSGYSLIAIGVSKLFGLKLTKNFDSPYFSRSIQEFWTRWHISLSNWFRDYLYIPLGGNQGGTVKIWRNIMITFVLSGLWHGASLNFILWGFIHGTFVIIESLFKKMSLFKCRTNGIINFLRIVKVFLIVSFSWIFFRCSNIIDSFIIIDKIADFILLMELPEFDTLVLGRGLDKFDLLLSFLLILILNLVEYFCLFDKEKKSTIKGSFGFKILIYVLLVYGAIFLVTNEASKNFIYFQF